MWLVVIVLFSASILASLIKVIVCFKVVIFLTIYVFNIDYSSNVSFQI